VPRPAKEIPMRASKLRLLAATAIVAGVAGCSLPEVRQLAGGTTAGPSPYGPWYEQHWATNAVLLAAADEEEHGNRPASAAEQTPAQPAEQAAVEASASTSEETRQSDPSYDDASAPPPAIEGPDASAAAAPAPKSRNEVPAATSGPVRY
jgi:hypothetical protein